MKPSSGSAAAALPFDVERPLEDERPFPPPAAGNSNDPVLTPGMDIIGGHPPELTLKVLTFAFYAGGGIDAPLGGGGGIYYFALISLDELPPPPPSFLSDFPKAFAKNPFFFSFSCSYAGGYYGATLASSTYSYLAGADPC